MIKKFKDLEFGDQFTSPVPRKIQGCGLLKINEGEGKVYSPVPAIPIGSIFKFKPEATINKVGHF